MSSPPFPTHGPTRTLSQFSHFVVAQAKLPGSLGFEPGDRDAGLDPHAGLSRARRNSENSEILTLPDLQIGSLLLKSKDLTSTENSMQKICVSLFISQKTDLKNLENT